MKKILFIIYSILIFNCSTFAQSINLEFPYFAGKTYEFKIVQGDKHIILQKDTIRKNGIVTLTIPDEFKGYKGMAMWYLTNSKEGGGLEMIINQENFSVTCLDSIPTKSNIIYKNTLENAFLDTINQQQEDIFARHDAMLYATKAYKKSNPLYAIFEKEYQSICSEYTRFANKVATSSLYAAQFNQIVTITRGIGTDIVQNEFEKANNINSIIVNKLDFSTLYTSNHWGGVIISWIQMHVMVLKNDKQFLTDITTILNKLPTNELYTEFVMKLTKELAAQGKDEIIDSLISTVKTSKKLNNYNGILNLYNQDLSGKAPDLKILEPAGKNSNKDVQKTINLAKTGGEYNLLIFYQSDCGHCEEVIQGIKYNYIKLVSKNVEVFTLSADTDEQVFNETAATFQWTHKYCDFQGFNGPNFKNYAVVGTPTLFLLDKKGIIIKKMSGLKELLDWLK